MRNKSCFFILNGKRIEKDEILNLLSDLVNNFLEKILMYGHILCRAITTVPPALPNFWQISYLALSQPGYNLGLSYYYVPPRIFKPCDVPALI